MFKSVERAHSFYLKLSRKHIISVFLIIALGMLGYFFIKPVEISLYSTPIALNEVFSDGSVGVWEGVHYLQHDCYGCETRNRHILSITTDSSGILIQEIDPFRILIRSPYNRLVFGYSPQRGTVKSTKVGIRGDCLVFFNSEPNYTGDIFLSDSSALNHFKKYYRDFGCEIKPNDIPTEAFQIDYLPKKMILTPKNFHQ